MPIVPCFDPDTGASGGPSSGGGPAPGPGAHEWVPELTLDLETATPVAQVTASGSHQTAAHVMGAVTLDANLKSQTLHCHSASQPASQTLQLAS